MQTEQLRWLPGSFVHVRQFGDFRVRSTSRERLERITPQLTFGDYWLPSRVRWCGVGVMLFTVWLF